MFLSIKSIFSPTACFGHKVKKKKKVLSAQHSHKCHFHKSDLRSLHIFAITVLSAFVCPVFLLQTILIWGCWVGAVWGNRCVASCCSILWCFAILCTIIFIANIIWGIVVCIDSFRIFIFLIGKIWDQETLLKISENASLCLYGVI